MSLIVVVKHNNALSQYGYYAEIDAELFKNEKCPEVYDSVILEKVSKYNEAYKKSEEIIKKLLEDNIYVYDAYVDDLYLEQVSLMKQYAKDIDDRTNEIRTVFLANKKDTYSIDTFYIDFKEKISKNQTESAKGLIEKFGFAGFMSDFSYIGVDRYITKVKDVKRLIAYNGEDLPFSYLVDLLGNKFGTEEERISDDNAGPVGIDPQEITDENIINYSTQVGYCSMLEIPQEAPCIYPDFFPQKHKY